MFLLIASHRISFSSLGFNPMFPGSSMGSGSGMTMGSMGGGSFSSGCTGPFCIQSTSKYL